MSEDRRDFLQVLRYELNFLEQGGYKHGSPFLNSLACLNFGDPLRPHTCRECCLYDFVPKRSRTEDVPCHFIPLDEAGTNVARLLKTGSRSELEAALKRWLRSTVAKLEKEQGQLAPTAD